jgi:hypothetical protein
MEVIGEQPFRTRVKRRKARTAGESATSDEAQIPLRAVRVLATGWRHSLRYLPSEVCRGPRNNSRWPQERENEG